MIADLMVPQNLRLDLGGSIARTVSMLRKSRGSTYAGMALEVTSSGSSFLGVSSTSVESPVSLAMNLVVIMNR